MNLHTHDYQKYAKQIKSKYDNIHAKAMEISISNT